MPYSSVDELPPDVRDAYSDECQQVFIEAFNGTEGTEEEQFAAAHAAAQDCTDAAAQPDDTEAAGEEPAEDCGCATGQKVIALKEASVSESGELTGYGNVTAVVDDGGDKVLKGAFGPALERFVKEGFISWAHDWALPVAYPTEAKEDERGLYIAAKFHSTPAAQEARTITAERLAAGKTMGLSIGYEVDKAKDASYGRDIVSFKRIFEVGLVTVPMNSQSLVSAVKGGPGSGQTWHDRLRLVSAEARAAAIHARAHRDMRLKEGRVLSSSNRELLKSTVDALEEARRVLNELLRVTDPGKEKAALLALRLEAERTLARIYAR